MNRKYKISLTMILCTLLLCGSLSLIHAYSMPETVKADAQDITYDNLDAISEIIGTNKEDLKYENDLSSKLGINTFSDKSDNEYFFNEQGNKVTGFAKNEINPSNKTTLNENDIKRLSSTYLSEISGAKRYQLTDISYSDSTKTYSISYYYFIDTYKTSDMVYLSIDNTGELVAFSAPNVGAFDDINIPHFTESDVYSYISTQIQNTCGADTNLYSINDIIIDKDDNGIFLNVDATYGKTEQDSTENLISIDFNNL